LPVSRRVLSCFESRPNNCAGAASADVEKTDADNISSDNMTSTEAPMIAFLMSSPSSPIPNHGGHYQSK